MSFPSSDSLGRPFFPTLVRAYVGVHRNWPWVLLYGLVLVGSAWVVGVPLMQSLDEFFGHRPAAAELYPGPRVLYLREWLRQEGFPATWNAFVSLALGVGLALWVFHLLVSSGWLTMVGLWGLRRHPVGTGLLLGVRSIGRQVQAWPLWAGLWVAGATAFVLALRVGLGFLIRTHRDEWVVPTFYGGLALGLAGLGVAGFHWDLTRVLAMQSLRKPGLAAWRAVRVAGGRWGAALRLIVVYALIPAGAVSVLALAHKTWMASHPATAAVLGWLTYALELWVRIWSRLAYYAHLSLTFVDPTALVEALRPAPEPTPGDSREVGQPLRA